jgi:hypothetical protein
MAILAKDGYLVVGSSPAEVFRKDSSFQRNAPDVLIADHGSDDFAIAMDDGARYTRRTHRPVIFCVSKSNQSDPAFIRNARSLTYVQTDCSRHELELAIRCAVMERAGAITSEQIHREKWALRAITHLLRRELDLGETLNGITGVVATALHCRCMVLERPRGDDSQGITAIASAGLKKIDLDTFCQSGRADSLFRAAATTKLQTQPLMTKLMSKNHSPSAGGYVVNITRDVSGPEKVFCVLSDEPRLMSEQERTIISVAASSASLLGDASA